MVGISMAIKYIFKLYLKKIKTIFQTYVLDFKSSTKFNTMAFFQKILNVIVRNIKNAKK
jgi:hypothetical protein